MKYKLSYILETKLKEINSSDLEMHEVYPPDVVLLLYDITDPNSLAWVADIFIVNSYFFFFLVEINFKEK